MLIDNIIVRITSQMKGRYMSPKKKTKLQEVVKRRGDTPVTAAAFPRCTATDSVAVHAESQ